MKKFNSAALLSYLFLLAASIFVLLPFIWTFLTSIKTDIQVFVIPPAWIPNPATIKNYLEVLREGNFQHYMKNSLIISIGSTLLAIAIGAPAAYGFAKYKYKFSGFLFAAIVIVRMLPPIVLNIPFFLMMRNLGLINTVWALIIVYVPLELTLIIWILEGFFRQIPHEIEEAAEIDGLGVIGKFFKIVVPLSVSALGVTFIFSFLLAWNEFMFALTLTYSVAAQTMPVGIAGYVTSFQIFWGKMSAMGILYILPVVIFTLIAQRGLIKGLTAGAIKE